MKITLARCYFWLARQLLSRGNILGQWFQNKAILLLASMKVNRD